jgi:hypothetical protein
VRLENNIRWNIISFVAFNDLELAKLVKKCDIAHFCANNLDPLKGFNLKSIANVNQGDQMSL